MEVVWRRIPEFPKYSVSNTGYVRNDETGRLMSELVNQAGVVNVGLTNQKVQYKRSVALLVAYTFIETRQHPAWDCPINLDGDRHNNDIRNLMWRPRWFATKYFQQFNDEHISRTPVEDLTTEICYEDSWHAATTLGLLYKEVLESAYHQTPVWPIHHQFHWLPAHADINAYRTRRL